MNLNWAAIIRWGCILTTVFALGTLVGCNKSAGAATTATATVVSGEFSVNAPEDVTAHLCDAILDTINTINDGPEWPFTEAK